MTGSLFEEACDKINVGASQGWILPSISARDVDEAL